MKKGKERRGGRKAIKKDRKKKEANIEIALPLTSMQNICRPV